MKKKIGSVVILLILAGCNTIRGVGADIQHGGAAISNAATEVQSSL